MFTLLVTGIFKLLSGHVAYRTLELLCGWVQQQPSNPKQFSSILPHSKEAQDMVQCFHEDRWDQLGYCKDLL